MNSNKRFHKQVKELVNNPDFQKPLSELNKDYSKQGTIKLVTNISKLCQKNNFSMPSTSSASQG